MTASPQADSNQQPRKVRAAVAGLESHGADVARLLNSMPQFELTAVSDPRPEARAPFEKAGVPAIYANAQDLYHDSNVDVVWICTANQDRLPDTVIAAEQGKAMVIDKPMALTLDDAVAMVEAAEKNGVKMFQGHTMGLTGSVRTMRALIASGELGRLRALNVSSNSDWMFRPRLPHEVETASGGGVVYRSGPHQMDVVRILGGGLVRSVRGTAGEWMSFRHAPGYYSAFVEFEDGSSATVTLNGYGYFSSYEFVPWAGQGPAGPLGPQIRRALRQAYGSRGSAAGPVDERALIEEVRGSAGGQGERRRGAPGFNPDLGIVIASCERGDIRQSPEGLWVYDDDGQREVPAQGIQEENLAEATEVYESMTQNRPPLRDGRWALGTIEVVLAIMQSARERREIMLSHQVPTVDRHILG